jgi:1-phosphofructokinase family hexose kinase
MIICLGTTPAAQRVMVFGGVTENNVNRATTVVDGAAGKSVNVAKVLKVFGETPVALGFLGGPWGEHIRTILKTRGVETDFVSVDVPTRQCITVVDQAAGTQTELVEESRAVTAADYERLFSLLEKRLPRSRAVVMSGTVARGGPPDFYGRVLALARPFNVLTVVDAQGEALLAALAGRPGLVKPNRSELAATTGRKLLDDSETLAAMRELHEKGAERVVVTAGKAPTLAFDGRTAWQISGPAVRPVNPIGSGDSFTAAVVWRLLKGDDLAEACRWGSAAGAANALTLMPGEFHREDLESLAAETTVQKLPGF